MWQQQTECAGHTQPPAHLGNAAAHLVQRSSRPQIPVYLDRIHSPSSVRRPRFQNQGCFTPRGRTARYPHALAQAFFGRYSAWTRVFAFVVIMSVLGTCAWLCDPLAGVLRDIRWGQSVAESSCRASSWRRCVDGTMCGHSRPHGDPGSQLTVTPSMVEMGTVSYERAVTRRLAAWVVVGAPRAQLACGDTRASEWWHR